MTAYFNVHGQPLATSARDVVLVLHPFAVAESFMSGAWAVRKTPRRYSPILGTGANEEAAWRDAWSRMLADDVAREGRSA